LEFSPSSSAFAAASTEGLLIYSTDNTVVFDPFDLDIDVTPAGVHECLHEKQYTHALVMAFRLNEQYLLDKVVERIPPKDIQLVVGDLPEIYVNRLLKYLGEKLNRADGSHHIEFSLIWVKETFNRHGRYINSHKFEMQPNVRLIQRFLARVAKDVVQVSKKSGYLHSYLVADHEVEEEEKDGGEEEANGVDGHEVYEDSDIEAEDDTHKSDTEEYEEWHGMDETDMTSDSRKITHDQFAESDSDMED